MAGAENPPRLGYIAARTVWLFQALIAGFLAIIWVIEIFREVENPRFGANAYPVIRELFLSLLAAMIIFIVIVQWHFQDPRPRVTARLELGKGLIATAMSGWLLLDAIFFVPRYPYYYDPYHRKKAVRIALSAGSFAIPLVLFYPPAFWSARLAWRDRRRETPVAADGNGATADENSPLLRGE